MTDNPFGDIDYGAAPTDKPQQAEPASENPFAQIDYENRPQVGVAGAVATGAAESVTPTLGGLAGAGYGATFGEMVAGPPGAIVGGIAGALGGGYLAGKGQDYAVKSLPNDWRDPIEETEEAAQEQHPYASFLGGLVPMALTMSPRIAPKIAQLPPNATAMQRIMANPATARLFGGAIQGAMELGQEKAQGQDADWAKIAMSTAFGVLFNKTNAIGERIEGAGARFAPAFRTRAEPHAPTVNDAQDVKVAGPGVTEEVFQGSHEQDEAAAQVAQEAKRTEDLILHPEPPPPPDVSNVVARMEPELIQEHDALIAQRDSLADLATREGPESPAAKHLAEVNGAIEETAPQVEAAYQRAAEAVGGETVEPEKKAGEAAPAGAMPPEAATPPTAKTQAPEHDVGREQIRTPDEQRQWIADDLERRLVAAGRPADEASASAQVVASGYETRAARMGGALGTPEELYLREHPDIIGPTGREIPPGVPPGGTAPPIPAPAPAPEPEAPKKPRVAPRKPRVAATEGGETREIGVNWEGNPIFEDERGVRSILHPAGIRETEPVLIAPGGAISVRERGADFTPVAEAATGTELEKPAPVAPPEPQTPAEVSSVETPAPAQDPVAPAPAPREAFIAAIKDKLAAGERPFRTIVDARALAKEHGLEFGEDVSANKEVDELVERAVVETARGIVDQGLPPGETYTRMVQLYENQPNLSTRTSTSVAEQAYSTPAPLAYVASRRAGIDHDTYVLEPTAGNGMLLMEANPRKARVNEINPTRLENLRAQGFRPSSADGASLSTFADSAGKMDAVIANPPFGAVKEGGKSRVFNVDGFETTQIDHAIALNSLKTMKADGKAVLIIGGVKAENEAERANGYMSAAKRRFFHQLLSQYNVTDVFTVDGGLYAKQGAGWPVDVITIDGKGKSERVPLTKEPPPLLKTWAEVGDKLNGLERAIPETGVAEPDRLAGVEPVAEQPGPAGPNNVGGQPVGGGEPVRPSTEQIVAAGLDGTGDSPEPGRDGPVNPLAGGEGQPPGEVGGLRGTDTQPHPERGRPVEADVNEGQVKYEPASQEGVKLNTLLPANLRDATNESLDRLERQKGPIDNYVAEALGRTPGELGKYFSAEQIDAIGLGISNIQKGEGFIIGDQTGIGKGRVVAAMISYAKRHGLTPVFVTEKPDLYGDMWRDLHDIGWHEQLGREIKMMMTNAGTRVPLDDEALEWIAERDQAKQDNQPVPPMRGAFSASQSSDKATANMGAVLRGEASPDVVFTTYDQMNGVKGQETPRRQFLTQIAPRSFLIMDEAHNAGGSSKNPEDEERFKSKGAPPRSEVFRDAVTAAHSVMYSSATYAKSPSVMTLYSKTDMAKAVANAKDLPELITRGGVPLQQVVASMLAKAGQYMRRERSFEGVSYDHENIPVSEKAYGEFTDGLRAVFQFDRMFGSQKLLGENVSERDKLGGAIAAERGAGTQNDTGVGETAASSTSFAAIMHNVISQMIMALKAEKAGERAVQSLKAGERPVIALSKTNASFISDFTADAGLGVGDKANISFSDILKKYLERTRRVTIKLGNDVKEHHTIPLSDMSAEAQAAYARAEDTLREIEIGDLPVSPIDAIRNVIQKAGFSVREVTGRDQMLDYSEKEPVIVKRPASEYGSAGKKLTVKQFNDGKVDAVILNKSGSTGISMHASSKFPDQRKRRMIIAEADPNIDTHMQMLGRVHRTGQVIPPAYTHLSADIPAEVRPTAVLMRKMASLNANTTGAAKSRFSSDAVDFMNKYGDQVVASVMNDEPDVWARLGAPAIMNDEGQALPGAAAKITGRLTLLAPKDQQALLDRIAKDYKSTIAALDASGANDLEAKSLDLRARTLSSTTMKAPTGLSPFQGPVNLEKVSVNSQGRAMAPSEVLQHVADALKMDVKQSEFVDELPRLQKEGKRIQDQAMANLRGAAMDRMRQELATLKDPEARERATEKIKANLLQIRSVGEFAHPGAVVTVKINGEESPAVVIGFKQQEGSKSPVAPSSWEATVAFPNRSRSLGIPLSRISLTDEGKEGVVVLSPNHMTAPYDLANMFEAARKEGREDRYMFTGNILAAFDETRGRGQIINHTMENGSTRPAILMNRQFKPEEFAANRAVKFKSGEHVLNYLNISDEGMVKSSDGLVTIRPTAGGYDFEVPAAKSTGGKYYADNAVRQIYDRWNRKSGMMTGFMRPEVATKVIDAMQKIGATFETRTNQEKAIAATPQPGAADIRTRIEQAYLKVTGGKFNQRGVLADIRSHLQDLPREAVDAELRKMGGEEGVNLMGLDNKQEVTPERQAAAVDVGGEPRHLLWLDRAKERTLAQLRQGKIDIRQGMRSTITLLKNADASTFMHETAHDWLEKLMGDAKHEAAPPGLRVDAEVVRKWVGAQEGQKSPFASGITPRQHERFARGFEAYLREGVAPSRGLAAVFAQFKNWLTTIYQTVKSLGRPINDDIRRVFDRLIEREPQSTVIAAERGGPSLATIHEHDAAETPPQDAEAARDRIITERDQAAEDHPPEIAHEIASAHAEAQDAEKRVEAEGRQQGAEPGPETPHPPGEAGAGPSGHGALGGDSGKPEPVAAGGGGGERSGQEQPGGGNAVTEGNAGAGAVAGPEPGRNAQSPIPLPKPRANLDAEPDSQLVDLAGNIRVDNLNINEDVAKAIREAAEQNNDFIGDRRGKITDGMVEMIADALGMDMSDLSTRKIGEAWNAEQVWAARKLLVQSATIVSDLAKKAADGTDDDLLAYATARDRHQMVQATVAGITAEAGRALRAFRRMEGQEGAEQIGEIIQGATGRTLYQLKKEAKLVSGLDTPEKVSKFMHSATKPGYGDMVLEYWINGLISGPATHVTYTMGNTAFAAWRAGPETAVSAMIGRMRAAAGREGERVQGREVGAQFGAGVRSLPAAVAGAAQSFREGVTLRLPGEKGYEPTVLQPGQIASPGMAPTEATWKDAAAGSFAIVRGMRDAFVGGSALLKAGGVPSEPGWGARYSNLGAIPDITYRGVGVLPIGTLARAPSRFIASIHTFFRVMNYSMEKSALGVRQAIGEGRTGDDLEARIGELWQNPSADMMKQAAQQATEATLMSSQGEFTRNLARLTNTPLFGIKIFKFIDPFVRISSNIIEEGLAKRTPLGVLSPAIRADISGKNGNVAQDRAMARMLCGTATAVLFGGLAANGYVSGSGPTDPRLNAMWRLAGNQAHSVRIGDMWYDMHRLGPLGLLMSTAADMYDVAHLASDGDMLKAGAALQHGITQNILDESFMRGPADLIKTMEDPGRYGEAYLRQWAGSFLPYSVGMAQMARASDPYSRQARSVMDEIRRRIPGQSESLLPRRDIWGQPLANPDALIAAGVTSIYERQMSRDPVNLAMLNLGIGPAMPERKIRGVQLDDGQYDDFQRIAGRMAKMRLDAIVGSGQFSSWPANVQHDVIVESIRQSRETARGVMMMKYPSIMREATEAKQKKAMGQR